jgi:hypothetical protein
MLNMHYSVFPAIFWHIVLALAHLHTSALSAAAASTPSQQCCSNKRFPGFLLTVALMTIPLVVCVLRCTTSECAGLSAATQMLLASSPAEC